MTLRVIHALDKNLLSTGSVVQMVETVRGLAARGHEVRVISRAGGDLEQVCAADSIPFTTLPLRNPFDLGSAWALRRLLQRVPVDLIHVHKGRPHSISLIAAAGLGARPLLVVNRGVSFPLDRWNRWKYHHPRVAAVVCVADAVRRQVIASGRLRPERVHTIPAGTDLARFDPTRIDPAVVRDELGLAPEHLLVTQVSVRDWKGWRELIAAFALVGTGYPQARLLLVGCEPASVQAKVMALVAEHQLGDTVLTLPYRHDLPQVLAASDLVVDASWRGTGITGTLREAMAVERAVIATDCGGNRELVTADGVVGLLIPPGDVPALAAALQQLLGNRALRQQLARAGRSRVVAGYSTERRIDRLEKLYTRLLSTESQLPSCTPRALEP